MNLCDPTKQPHLYRTTLASPFSFFLQRKCWLWVNALFPCDKKMSRLNGSSSSSRDNTRRSGRRSQSGERVWFCAFFLWCGWFCSMWANTLLARKNFISSLLLWKRLQGSVPSFLPSLFRNTYKVPFIPSFSMVRHWKREGRCAQSMWVWEKERVYLLFLNHWRIFFLN